MKEIAFLIEQAKINREKEELKLQSIIEEEEENRRQGKKTYKKLPKEESEQVSKVEASNISIKPEKKDEEKQKEQEQEEEENKEEEEKPEESEEYESEEENPEIYQKESANIIALAAERKILDENLILKWFNLKEVDGDTLQTYKLEYINTYLEENEVMPLMNELMTRLI